MNRHHRNIILCLIIGMGLFVVGDAWPASGFAEEELGFRDQDGNYYPPSGDFPDNRISTVHDDLTFVLAVAAGFPAADSHTLRIWNQLVDSEILPSTPISYTYGSAGFPAPPDPIHACIGKNHARQVWPTAEFDPDVSGVTSRFGPYSPFFHFPHLGSTDLQSLRDWAWGSADTPQGYEAYAWGRFTDSTLMQAMQNDGCIITRTAMISMPVAAGSMEAFATYLHSLGDAYSHADCLDALADHSPAAPWGTHTVPVLGDPSIYACDYVPTKPQKDDAHGREFGSVYSDTQRTIDAARAIYAELSARSVSREGIYTPLSLKDTLSMDGAATTLDDAIVRFVTVWDYDAPAQRREYADRLLQTLLSQPRTSIKRAHLPLLLRQ